MGGTGKHEIGKYETGEYGHLATFRKSCQCYNAGKCDVKNVMMGM